MSDNLDLSILKSIINSKKLGLEFCHDCSEKLFAPDLWRFSKAVMDYLRVYKTPPTKRTLIEQVKKNESLVKLFSEIFDKLEAIKYNEAEYAFDLQRLKDRYASKLIDDLQKNLTGAEGKQDLKKGVADIQGTLNNIKSVSGSKASKEATLKDYSKDFMNLYRAKEKDPDFGVGIKTGYSFIDQATAGLRPSEMFLCAGTTGAGKSIFLANLVINMWKGDNDINTTDNFRKGCNVLLFSLEMELNDYANRLISKLASVEQKHIRDATLTDAEKSRVNKALTFIGKYPHYLKIVDVPKLTPEALELAINNEITMNGKPDVICVDYLNIMGQSNNNKENQDWLVQQSLSESLHQIARTFEVVMLSAVQLNPKGADKEEGGGFGIKALRRATAISDHTDFLAIINTRRNEKSYPDFAISLVKNRRGENTDAKLHKNFSCCSIEDQKIDENRNAYDVEDISGLV